MPIPSPSPAFSLGPLSSYGPCRRHPLWAQKDAGAIVGLVRDASGAVVTGAKVTVVDVDRGIQLTLSTNDAGQYVASPLRIGRYTITVEKEGFKKAVAGPVQVNIQDRVGVDLKLEPGMATEVVTVTGQRPQLETPKPPNLAKWWTAGASMPFP